MDGLFIYTSSAIVIAYIFDLLLGDPLWLPHPIVCFGRVISFIEKHLNKGRYRLLKGALSSLFLVGLTFLAFYYMLKWAGSFGLMFGTIVTGLFFFFGLANKTLIKEGFAVFKVLNEEGVEAGRKQVSRIVGRDTSQLNEQQIRKAVLETMAENLSDGVVASIFWYVLLGVPGMMAYKMINTLDSMIAYKNERYIYYGRVAAYIDDVANYIPARLTALFIVIVSMSFRAMSFVFLYGRKHSSPNAGYPEAALAGVLNVQFGGPNVYHGELIQKPFIGKNERLITHADIYKAKYLNHAVCLLSIILCVALQLIIH
ncbi:adenosylcobinamide-phosphate synthase CbiB [Carboxylicivirga marina]|uniref:adenosylcobinamide-phosphate synthase CbiB n=1 Tax=Carboxylicivirga marina TaxID=2800988 RepID=UPI00259AA649|nr:adenosylcobinamide-phosphate synthase CbiB [uncultured Carboxylicivirga sp.]